MTKAELATRLKEAAEQLDLISNMIKTVNPKYHRQLHDRNEVDIKIDHLHQTIETYKSVNVTVKFMQSLLDDKSMMVSHYQSILEEAVLLKEEEYVPNAKRSLSLTLRKSMWRKIDKHLKENNLALSKLVKDLLIQHYQELDLEKLRGKQTK